MMELTHLIFALTLAYLLDLPVVYAMIAGIFPDTDLYMDLVFPFVHRGILHTPVFILFAAVVLYLVTDRKEIAAAAGVGLFSHLFLDTITPMGIMWLYPLSATYFSLNLVISANLLANVLVLAYCVLLMAAWRYRSGVRAWIPR